MRKKDINPIKTRGFTFGCLLLLMSFWTWSEEGEFYDHGGYPVGRAIWILFLVVGLILLLHALFSKAKAVPQVEINSKICPSCLKTYSVKTKETKCAKCKINLETTKGFIDRHPYAFKRNNP